MIILKVRVDKRKREEKLGQEGKKKKKTQATFQSDRGFNLCKRDRERDHGLSSG